ncbi:MAG: PPOX class F420-dependent oxidoreductase [Herpetosiphonaceae bacterium]|nr:PPOX class F420-dependent oxidoreductase [Herpetosiphonaceae bacterium]
MADPWASLKGAKYISLTTFRKNGTPVPTPVWFAELDSRVVVYTLDNSGKIKRIRNNAHVELAASDARGTIQGPKLQGSASIIPAGQAQRLEAALNRKYPWKRLFNLFARIRRTPRVYLDISSAS